MLASMSEIDPRVDLPLVNWSDLGVSGLLPTGTVTLLLADVENSTGLWESQPEQMTAAFERLDQALSDLLAAYGGVRPVEQGEGDSFVVAFARASDAVACALELQRAPLAPISLRIGVHTGEVQLRDEGNYIGPTINRTARLRNLAHGGQTVLSGATEALVARHAARRYVAGRSGHPRAARCCPPGTGCAAVSSRSAQRLPAAAHSRKVLLRIIFRRSSPALWAAARSLPRWASCWPEPISHPDRGRRGRENAPGDRSRHPGGGRLRRRCLVCGPRADHRSRRWCRWRWRAHWACPINPAARRWTRAAVCCATVRC